MQTIKKGLFYKAASWIMPLGLLLSITFPARAQVDFNGGFEAGEERPEGWFESSLPDIAQHVAFAWDDQIHHSGRRSVSVTIEEGHPPFQAAYNWTTTVPDFERGAIYELRGWVKTERMGDSAWISVQCWNKKEKKMLAFATTYGNLQVKGTTDWTEVSVMFQVPKKTKVVRIRAGIATNFNTGGKAWFDDIDIRRIETVDRQTW
ncbi:MAG TPA: hypothetical protein VID27_06255 [Blastocatellia bacterium]|jgi:hypothetical protein